MLLIGQTLYRLRVQVLAYGVGLALLAVLHVSIYPSMESSLGDIEYPEAILEAFGIGGVSLADPRAFFGAEFFAFGPLVLSVFAVFASTAVLAGEETSGTMETLAALPISRCRMFLQKLFAVLLATLGIAALTSVGWAVSVPFIDLGWELTLWDLVRATFVQVPFAAFLIAAGLLLGAIAPSRSTAAGWTGALLITSYLLVTIASTVDSVEDLRYASPYYYSDLSGVLIDGVEVQHQAVLWSVTAIIGVLALVAFEGREFGSERWQFGALLPRRRGAAMSVTDTSRVASAAASARRRMSGGARLGVLLALLTIAVAGGVAAYRYASTLPVTVSVSGRVDAPSVAILAPTSGIVSVLNVAEGQDVKQGDVLGWMENTLDKTLVVVSAPHSGRITTLTLHQGQFAVAGTVVVVIHELASLHVLLEVDEDDIGRVAAGQPADLSFTSLGLKMTAPVGSVASIPTANPAARPGQSRKYEVKVPLDGSNQRILVGLPVDARIHVDRPRS